MLVEELGMYELRVTVDGVDQGSLLIAVCRSSRRMIANSSRF